MKNMPSTAPWLRVLDWVCWVHWEIGMAQVEFRKNCSGRPVEP